MGIEKTAYIVSFCRGPTLAGVILLALLFAACRQSHELRSSFSAGFPPTSFNDYERGDPAIEMPDIITLADAKRLALQTNPTVAAARQRAAAAAARWRQAAAAYYPQLTAAFTATHQHDQSLDQTFGLVVGATETYVPTLTANWLLFDGFVREFDVLAARFDVEAATAAHDDARRLLLRSVARAYFAARLAQNEIEINDADRDFNQSFYDETEKKRVRGMAPRSDALNFKIRLEKARIRSLDSSRDYRLAILVLAELLGMPTAGIVQTPDLKPESVGMSLELAGLGTLLDTAWVTRTDLQEMKAGLNRAKAELGAAAGARFPQLFLTGDIGTFSRDDFRVERDNRTSSFGIIANWDVFTGGAKAAMVKAARADYAATLEDLNRLWDAIVGEIRQQLEIVRTAWEKLRIQREITAMTHGIRSDIEKEYKAGQASLTRLNEVQRDLLIARERLARNRAEYLQSSEDLAAATGEILAPYLQPAPDKLTR